MAQGRMELYGFQKEILKRTENEDRCAYFVGMGLGKTLLSSEHVSSIALPDEDIIVICQLSKVRDWVDHWRRNYHRPVCDYTRRDPENPKHQAKGMVVVVNYDLIWRRPIFKEWRAHLIVDESSLIQNDTAKRTKFIMGMHPLSVTLLSGTPCSGRYENLWTQARMLGWSISKTAWWDSYVIWHLEQMGPGTPRFRQVDGYKNTEHMKRRLGEFGAVFMRTEEAIGLPDTVENTIRISKSDYYREFTRNRIITIQDNELIGDNSLTRLLRLRQICGIYCWEKMKAVSDILISTDDRVVIFYNFKEEEERLRTACHEAGRKPFTISGEVKEEQGFHDTEGAVLLVQYQAGSMGLNLQDCNRVVYYTPTLSTDQFEQSKARIHRIGQKRTCFYTYLVMENSVEEHIYDTLSKRADYTLRLFDKLFVE